MSTHGKPRRRRSEPDAAPAPDTLCCDGMRAAMQMTCTEHLDPFACPEQLLAYSEEHDRFGLIVHDGGRDVIEINFCPWCGADMEKDDA